MIVRDKPESPWLDDGLISWICRKLSWAFFVGMLLIGLWQIATFETPIVWWQLGIACVVFLILSIATDKCGGDDFEEHEP